ncbi:MAG TPA: alpha/beta hydrolase [Dehalococcoidia bacterium]|nr:alpha/beta hydrolase [Dehalococcoidia bacterium]
MQPTHYYVDLSTGIRAHYLRWGDGTKQPILLAHATGFLAALWAPIAEQLSDQYTVIAPDARGHGDSDKPDVDGEAYDWHRLVEDHEALLSELRLHRIPFVGHSAGAAVGMYIAAKHPQYYSRIVAIEPIIMPGGVKPDEARRTQMAEGARKRRSVFASVDEMFEQYRERSLFDRWPDDVLRLYCETGSFTREDGQMQLKCPPEVEGALFANSGSLDAWRVLPDVAVPTLVVRGTETEPFLSMTAASVAERLPAGRLETVEGVGHLLPMEDPERVTETVLGFLRDG